MSDLTRDFDTQQVADALGMSIRWVRQKVKEGAEHQRYGKQIKFTAEQVEKLRSQHTHHPQHESITTGRRRRA